MNIDFINIQTLHNRPECDSDELPTVCDHIRLVRDTFVNGYVQARGTYTDPKVLVPIDEVCEVLGIPTTGLNLDLYVDINSDG